MNQQQKDPFAGIVVDTDMSLEVTPKTKEIHIENFAGSDPEAPVLSTLPTTFVSVLKRILSPTGDVNF